MFIKEHASIVDCDLEPCYDFAGRDERVDKEKIKEDAINDCVLLRSGPYGLQDRRGERYYHPTPGVGRGLVDLTPLKGLVFMLSSEFCRGVACFSRCLTVLIISCSQVLHDTAVFGHFI